MSSCTRIFSLVTLTVPILLAVVDTEARADTPDLTEFLAVSSPPEATVRCANQAIGVYADADGNGSSETMVVFNTLQGEAFAESNGPSVGYGTKHYFFSGINSHCGGSFPYATGYFTIWFVDALAPGFVPSNAATWVYKSVPGVELVTSSDACLVGGLANGYRQVNAYTERQQGGTLAGSYQASSPFPPQQTCDFSSPGGIKEIYVRTDFCENDIRSFIVRSGPTCSAPSIQTQPQAQTACLGGTATFSATAAGSAPISYQWYQGGQPIPGATSSSLTINPVTAQSLGEYSCTATNACGSATTDTAILDTNCGTVSYRVNAGGPQVASADGGPAWSADTAAAPSAFVNAAATGNATGSTATPIDMGHASIPAGTPVAIMQDERWDPPGGAELQWNFPVSPGDYQVRLYFAEIYTAIVAPGMRTFDVAINGQPVLTAFDTFAQVGQNKGLVKYFNVSVQPAQQSIAIGFAHRVENPQVQAIEIVRVCAAPQVQTQPQSLSVCVGEPASLTVVATGGPPLSFQWYHGGIAVPGATGATYGIPSVAAGDGGSYSVYLITPCGTVVSSAATLTVHVPVAIKSQPRHTSACIGQPAALSVLASNAPPLSYQWYRNGVLVAGATESTLNFNPVTAADAGTYFVRVTGPCSSAQSVAVTLDLFCETVDYRVNCGGPLVAALDDGPAWSADTAAAPSPYVNAAATGNATGATATAIDMSDPSVLPGTPMTVVQDERWDPPGSAEMRWSFPVNSGSYLVRLYFAEIYTAIVAPGMRLFDASINGQSVLTNFDMFAEVGQHKAQVKTFVVSVPASPSPTITIDFAHRVENPEVQAIEIVHRNAATDVPSVAPRASALYQNVPNPFNPRTTVAFALAEPGRTSVRIYDVAGRLVTTLLDAEATAGEHRLVWDGTDSAGRPVAAGAYMYRIVSGDLDQTRRMILVK